MLVCTLLISLYLSDSLRSDVWIHRMATFIASKVSSKELRARFCSSGGQLLETFDTMHSVTGDIIQYRRVRVCSLVLNWGSGSVRRTGRKLGRLMMMEGSQARV
jgi:hypothetical protein